MMERCSWLLVLLILKGLLVLVALIEFLVVLLILHLLWLIVYFNFFSEDWLTLLRFCFLRSSGALGMDEALSTDSRIFFVFLGF